MTKNSTKRKAYDRLEEIIEMFDNHKDHIKSTYKEEQVRIQFINPMFDALGWDMDNTKRKVAPAYRDVIHEDRLNVLGKMKAPDYCFTIDGKKQFFLEAKKSSIDIKSDVLPSFQLRRYGWSAKLPISILTDFEELAIYDCTKMPKPKEKASKQRLKYLEYQKYLKEFDWIWEYFSREQVEKGSLAQLANIEKRGTETVDDAFLNSLDDWRMQLATNIALRNPNLDEDAINYLVKINLNRIVFLRNCEDRSVEPYGLLKDCVSKKGKEGQFFKNLYKTFQEADRKYNSGLFDFNKDELSKSVQIDNKVVKSVIEELYYPNSPYEFSVIGAEILGTAYERFLGKVIRLTKGHRAKIEEKPEVRKAGGVFYTPQYIVNYIVENTVGKIIEKKTPEEIAKIKICDPACGSGSFLLGAYQYLLDYHLNWYTKKEAENAAKRKKNKNKILSKELTHDGNLTTEVKKQILLNNIFGVDIDAQAVEVTRLSLLMKCMEGETGASVQMSLTFDRILPSLDDNVKVGNSLIDFDYYDGQLDFGDDKKIKPFNWKNAFPKVFKHGGFDAVIGNPPYVVLEGEFRDDDQLNYFRKKYNSASYKIDLYHLFFEQGIKLLNKSGKLGYITPSNYLSNNGLVNLRDLILSKSIIEEINVITGKVFIGASIVTGKQMI
jgi:type I restriction-modification system DNA methylase subunit